jgi:hypothetical protein
MRKLSLVMLGVCCAAAFGVRMAEGAGASPIVSPTADPYYKYGGLHGTRGFGQVRPREIFYGGDPTGLVCRIRWVNWGGPTARGYGTGWYIYGNQSVAQGHFAVAIVMASRLGTWGGRRAYQRLTWGFPDHGSQRGVGC